MSQENVEIVTGHFGALVREVDRYWGDPRSFAAAAATGQRDPDAREVLDGLHPDVRWTNVLGEIYEGKLACARGVDQLLQASQEYVVRVDEVTDLGGDRVLVVVRSEMRGKSSGAPAAVSLFAVVTLRDGLVFRSDEYLSREAALEAVGLAE
jgi:ketosteroid isomerase-like protein